jgi:hypothetical protein
MSFKCKNSGAPPRTPLEELTMLPKIPWSAGRGLCPLPKPHPLVTFGDSILAPSMLGSPKPLHFSPNSRSLDKTLTVED